MPNWRKIITSGSDAALNSLNVTTSLTASGLIYPTADNGEESFMQTDGNGNLSFEYVKTVYEEIYNGEATSIIKGTPLYVSGSVGAAAQVFRADASIASKMPVIYVSADNIASGATGRGIALGLITGVDTTGYPAGTEIYVAAGGGWTSTRPTGTNIVQLLGIVTKEGAGGQGVIFNPGPNSLPNLPSGNVWVGNSNSLPTAVLTSSLSVATASFVNVAGLGGFVQNGNSFGTTAVLGTNDNQSLAFETNGTTKMFVSSSGNVGIGTVTPNDALNIVGYNKFIRIDGAAVTDRSAILGATANGTGDFYLFNGNNSNTVYVTGDGNSFFNNGNIGIGTTSPTARLHVAAQGALSTDIAFRVRNSANTQNFLVVNGAGDVFNNGAGGVTSNTFYGENSGRNATGTQNTTSGTNAGQALTSGASNSFFGNQSGQNNNTGGNNSFFGNSSGRQNAAGSSNSYFGHVSGLVIASGNFNVLYGALSGRFISSGADLTTINNSILIGYDTRALDNNQTNQIVIGYNAIGLGSNTTVLGNTSTTLFRPYGNVAINRNTATASLDVAGTTRISGSFNTAISGSILTVQGSGSAQPIFTVQGSQGELFSITDSLSGSLFSVNDISGLPILEVFSNNTILMGDYLAPSFNTTTKTTTPGGAFTIKEFPTSLYDGAFIEYTVVQGSDARAGTLMAIWNGTTTSFTETTTTDIGNTTDVTFDFASTGTDVTFRGNASAGWIIKCIIRAI